MMMQPPEFKDVLSRIQTLQILLISLLSFLLVSIAVVAIQLYRMGSTLNRGGRTHVLEGRGRKEFLGIFVGIFRDQRVMAQAAGNATAAGGVAEERIPTPAKKVIE
jgi:hypothetical protein